MTDDLVTRLRAETDGATVNPDGLEAADRIEELEKALLEIFDYEGRTSSTSLTACTARDALWPNSGEKKSD